MTWSYVPLPPVIAVLLYTIPKLPDFLLVIVRRKRTCCTKRDRHRRPSSRFHDSGNGGAEERDAVSKREFRSVVLILLDAVA